MKYSVDRLIQENKDHKYLLFWGHQGPKDGTISKACFSQWWPSPFIVDKIEYKTAEHWMMAKKAELFKDIAVLNKILASKTPDAVKKLGREVKNYNDAIWTKNRYEIVKEGNYHKFSQNKTLKEFLINTKDRILAEASPVDQIWGTGFAEDHENAAKPQYWKGLNLLGFALMQVRDELIK